MAYRDSTISITTTSTDTIPMVWPAVAAGDRAMLFIAVDASAGTWETALDGLVLVEHDLNATPDGQQYAVYERRQCDGTETGSFDFVPLPSQNGRKVAVLLTWSGRDNGAPVRFTVFSASTASNASPITMDSASGSLQDGLAVRAGDDVVAFWGVDQETDTDQWAYSTPSGFVERQQGSSDAWTSGAVFTKDGVAADSVGIVTSVATLTSGTGTGGWGSFVVAIPATITATVFNRDNTSAEQAFTSPISVTTPACADGDTLVLAIAVLNTYDTAVIGVPSVTGWAEPWTLRAQREDDAPQHGAYVYTTVITDASAAPATLDVTSTDNFLTRLSAFTVYGNLRVGRIEDIDGFGIHIPVPSVRAYCDGSLLLLLLHPAGSAGAITDPPPGLTLLQEFDTSKWYAYSRATDSGETGVEDFPFEGGGYVAFGLVLEAVPSPGTLINSVAQTFATTGTTDPADSTGAGLIVVNYQVGRPTSADPISLVDSFSNPYDLLEQPDFASLQILSMNSCISPTVGVGHTFTVTSDEATVIQVVVSMYYGVFVDVDQHSSDPSVFVTTSEPGPITTTFPNELVITSSYGQASGLHLVDDGFVDDDNTEDVYAASRMQAAPGVVDPTWTFTFVTYGFSAIASFQLQGTPTPPATETIAPFFPLGLNF